MAALKQKIMEAQIERDALKRDKDQLEDQLREEDKMKVRLGTQMASKVGQLNSIDLKLSREEAEHSWKKKRCLHELQELEGERKEKLDEMKEEEIVLIGETSAYEIVSMDHKMLTKSFQKAARSFHEEKSANEVALEKMKQHIFDRRIQMDQTIRKVKKELEEEYRFQGIAKMEEKSKFARIENRELMEVTRKQVDFANLLMARQLVGYERRVKAHIEQEAMLTAATVQQDQIAALRRRIQKEREERHSTQQKSSQLRGSINELLQVVDRRSKLLDQLYDNREMLATLQREAAEAQVQVVQLAQASIVAGMGLADSLREDTAEELVEKLHHEYGDLRLKAPTLRQQQSEPTDSSFITQSKDLSRIWQADKKETHIINGPLRKFLKQRRKLADSGSSSMGASQAT
jgi:hypothetical protein